MPFWGAYRAHPYLFFPPGEHGAHMASYKVSHWTESVTSHAGTDRHLANRPVVLQ